MARLRATGFTLIELLVVISIMVVLLAIVVPIGQRLRESNGTSRCETQLSHIGQSLKLYYLDEQGAPPAGFTDAGEDGIPDNSTVDNNTFPRLGVLYSLEYLHNRETLHCPRHVTDDNGAAVSKQSPEYYQSYQNRDTAAKLPSSPTTLDRIRQYKYLPYRWADATTYPDDYRRQLSRAAQGRLQADGAYTLVSTPSSSLPPDDTVVTWCNQHAETYTVNGHGQYVVLYWDGSVRLIDKEVFTDSTSGPTEAWLVKPTDRAGVTRP
jgi:prepilin-type N-terminal cleavage/methylation domain-containing protein